MNYLIILNDPPYGTERSYNGLRLANALVKEDEKTSVSVFLIGDAASCAVEGQTTPNGYYNIERMLKSSQPRGARSASAAPAWMRAASSRRRLRRAPIEVRWRSWVLGQRRRTR